MKYRQQRRKPRRQLHPLYERILRNHLHNLTSRKLSAMRDIYEQLPNRLECLDRQFVDDAFKHLSPAKRKLLNLRLRPLEEALGRDITRTAKPNLVKTMEHPPHFYEVFDSVIVMLKAKREAQNQTLLTHKNIRRMIAENLGITRSKVSNNLTRLVEDELMQQGIIEIWDTTQHKFTIAKTYRVNVTALDAHDKSRMESL